MPTHSGRFVRREPKRPGGWHSMRISLLGLDIISLFQSADMQASCESVDSRTSEYAELVSLFKAQQTQLELVIKALNPQEVAASSNHTSRCRRTVNGKPICFRCEQIGHIARFCPTLPNSDGNQHERAARADGQTTGAAEN